MTALPTDIEEAEQALSHSESQTASQTASQTESQQTQTQSKIRTKTRTKTYAVVALGDQTKPPSITDGFSESAFDSQDTTNRSASFLVSVDFSMISGLQNELTDVELAGGANNVSSQTRKADLCCGCCCDLVRACIIVDVCDILLSIMLVVVSVLGLELDESFINTIDFSVYNDSINNDDMMVIDDDDEIFRQEDNSDRLRMSVTVIAIMTGAGILFSFIGILGAYKLNKYLVLCTAIWYCVDFIRSAVTLQWVNSVVVACFAYPHFALFMALRKNKISRENYSATERHCCCGQYSL